MNRRGEQIDEHRLVDERDLEQVGHEIAAVDDLAREGLFDLPHRGDLTLDDEGAQRHWMGRRSHFPGYSAQRRAAPGHD